MGFSFRKSIKIAPGLRVNVSTKGVGLSGGVKGARVSVGPRGVHAYGGIGPLRFQKKLNPSTGRNQSFGGASYSSETQYGNPLTSLEKPTNWWAWLAFFGTCITAGLLSPLWIFTLVKGPKKVMTYRRWQKNKEDIASLNSTEQVEQLHKFNEEYPTDYFKVRIAKVLLESNRYEEALPHLEYFCQKYPIAEFFAACGECFHKLQKWDDAIECFEHCDEQNEYDGFLTVLKLKAESFVGKQEYDKALECVDSGIRKRGEQHIEGKRILKLARAKIYQAMGDSKKAEKEVQKLLKEVPNFEDALSFLSQVQKAS